MKIKVINNCKVKFYLETRTINHSGHPIMCRITINRKKAEFKIGNDCFFNDWDTILQCPKPKSNDAQSKTTKILEIAAQISRLADEGNRINKHISAKYLKDCMTGKSEFKHTVISAGKEVLNQYEKTKRAPENQAKIKNTLDYLEMFLTKNKKTEITLEEFTKQMVKDFEMFLKTEITYGPYDKKLDINTVGKHMSRFKTFWNHAMNSEWTTKNIISDFKIKREIRRRQSLDLNEFNRLKSLDLSLFPEKERVRDAFVFCCYLGLRFEDSQSQISVNDFELDSSTNSVRFICSKNGVEIQVPLLKGAKDIFNKYQNTNFRKIAKKVLPPFTNQHANRILKILAKDAEIDSRKKLTFHLSRHTCAQLQFEAGIQEKVTGAWLGQISNSITSQYQNSYEKRLLEAADLFENYLNSQSNM
jgi:integrase/recombinase XerD